MNKKLTLYSYALDKDATKQESSAVFAKIYNIVIYNLKQFNNALPRI